MLTNKGKKVKFISLILPPIPIHKLSRERAIAKNNDSLESIICELSKSEDIGLLKTLQLTSCFFKASKHIYIPIDIKIKLPINFVKKVGKIFWMKFPKNKEKYVVVKEIINKIIFPIKEIFVFLIPYVIPIPSESILLETDNNIEFNIITPLDYIIWWNFKLV